LAFGTLTVDGWVVTLGMLMAVGSLVHWPLMSGLLYYTWYADGCWQFGTLAVDGWAVTFGRAMAVGIWYTDC